MAKSSKKAKKKLSPSMSVTDFENGYWYATELRAFAKKIGVPATSKLRKNELERVVRGFLETGKLTSAPPRQVTTGERDSERSLRLSQRIIRYTNNKETKEFLLREAKRLDPDFKLQSGTRYRLNRWREEQISQGREITYGDLVRHFVELNSGARVPLRTEHGRYNNFVADFMAAHPSASRQDMIRAWNELKEMDAPKTYQAWVAQRKGRTRY